MDLTFEAWPKTPRLYRDVVLTEKIDGTNGAIIVTEEGEVGAQSRNRLVTPENDNAGFARWVQDNAATLMWDLGPGRHFGEWWGAGIQRTYGQTEKYFSLFNTRRFGQGWDVFDTPNLRVVPVLFEGLYEDGLVEEFTEDLRAYGSRAAPWNDAEGLIMFHTQSRQVYKVLLENDHLPKTRVD